jgi:hypothetical protein
MHDTAGKANGNNFWLIQLSTASMALSHFEEGEAEPIKLIIFFKFSQNKIFAWRIPL